MGKRSMKVLGVLLLLGLLSGCVDDRVLRLSSLLAVKTATARKEFEAAPTDAKKAEVARAYFDNSPAMTKLLYEYLRGVEPTDPADVKP